jgi:MoaA/NifB/PqqE/SkfB family radical SAM enzyme
MYNYSSILFNGNCNANCPLCIGKRKEFKNIESNLDKFPLKGIDTFINKNKEQQIPYISFSGIFSDPQQYNYELDLINFVKNKLPFSILSLHTNGQLALIKNLEFNSYNKITLSFPSFDAKTYKKMMGVEQIDIIKIIQISKIPIKLSMLLTEDNKYQVNEYIKNSQELGIKKILIRKLFEKEKEISIFEKEKEIGKVFGNPIYYFNNIEITIWNYSESTIKGLYLFPDGSLKNNYVKI